MNERFVLAIFTILMVTNAIMIILYALAITKTKRESKVRDIYYSQRFDAIEKIIKDQFTEIINLLKQR